MPPSFVLEKDIETGELMERRDITVNDESELQINPARTLVLSALPVDAKDAVDYFGVSKQRLEQLAPQVCWLVLRLIGMHVIRSRPDAEARLTGWLPYLTKHTHQLISERVRGYLA